ncbi:hypothetical protein CRG98_013156 [Punica granatum]|uniref:Uncharacterized protein n=1 Tax=Punica granatum TaxID=22663 RepID=A0A2I0KE17_PUNGR|nr:hypothetical protein CRG98_013156 [Punica granatum]
MGSLAVVDTLDEVELHEEGEVREEVVIAAVVVEVGEWEEVDALLRVVAVGASMCMGVARGSDMEVVMDIAEEVVWLEKAVVGSGVVADIEELMEADNAAGKVVAVEDDAGMEVWSVVVEELDNRKLGEGEEEGDTHMHLSYGQRLHHQQ